MFTKELTRNGCGFYDQVYYAKVRMESNLKQRIEFICEFCQIINGSIQRINNTDLNCIDPHKVIVNNITFLTFNYSADIYVGNLSKKIKLVEDYIKNKALLKYLKK